MTMLYTGGDCSVSNQCQDPDKFQCTDFNGGPPDNSQVGVESWIMVTDDGFETTYFDGPVKVYERFLVENGMERFPADQVIRIWSDSSKSEAALLQEVFYHSSCSQNLDLLNRFGAIAIVGWFNEEQGNITGFANTSVSVTASIPISADLLGDTGGSATVDTLTIITTATPVDGSEALPPTFFNLTDSVAGVVLQPDQEFKAEIAVPLDLGIPYNYNFLITLTATTDAGRVCTGTGLLDFQAGGLPPGLEFGNDACASIGYGDDGGGGGGGKGKGKGKGL